MDYDFLKKIDKTWTLFLDRDGTINKKIDNHYISKWEEFEFLEGLPDAFPVFNHFFEHTFIVTNQQGINKGLMSHDDIKKIHNDMLTAIHEVGGQIDEIYYCPELSIYDPGCRKPNPGMALQAQSSYQAINFRKSIMIGDSKSDMEFGRNLGMRTIWLRNDFPESHCNYYEVIDLSLKNLQEFATLLLNLKDLS